MPGVGPAVLVDDEYRPVSTYIQRDLLSLPRLATQLAKVMQRSLEERPGQYVEGPALCQSRGREEIWERASDRFRQRLLEPEAGTTQLVELMARAGQGKTMLLEHLALQQGRSYQPDAFPTPLLLPVDLLGRYIGTIDDAIAGSLNNTYAFPALTQKDVALAIRQRWIILALDGFDELAARIGMRDAFNRVTDLLEQLRGAGCVILSARESFFELYQVSAAMRSHLRPRRGSYDIWRMKLLPWAEEQGVAVFRGLGSERPLQDLRSLRAAFAGDEEIVFHPFFLTRLADLWVKGERFSGATEQADRLARARFVIETFVRRESEEKWRDRDGQPLLNAAQHTRILGAVAEEMWRAGAFRLDVEELRIAAEIGIHELDLAPALAEAVLERMPIHAALIGRERGFAFLHDRFLHYFLGARISWHLGEGHDHNLSEILRSRELEPDVVAWVGWGCHQCDEPIAELVGCMNRLAANMSDVTGLMNLGRLCAEVIAERSPESAIRIAGMAFAGEAFCGKAMSRVEFSQCRFWHVDLSGASFESCVFEKCDLGDVRVDDGTQFEDTRLVDCEIASLESADGRTAFVPEEIGVWLTGQGAVVEMPGQGGIKEPPRPEVDEKVKQCITRFVRQSERTCDVAVEEMAERAGSVAEEIARLGVEAGVLRSVSRDASGPRKKFVRFAVDRGEFLRGQSGRVGNSEIDGFWREALRRWPAKQR